ncbi:hypothetical protein B0O80DRAFT_423685 [Mortierella sp. GBAus27b]|nr:hypothetical protein B0O80DRAFT_423685 [Mortierella sp. GBAus27b]
MGSMAKSPTSLTASLSASLALYDNQEPPKTLQDILLVAQSHYISHRYVPALTLYKLAAEKHHSIPACSSLYALYTSTASVPGLVRSDTKATNILIHALRIWTARRWSSSRRMLLDNPGKHGMRSRMQDDHDELEEYFVHRRRPVCKAQTGPSSVPIRKPAKGPASSSSGGLIGGVPQSFESEYRTPLHLRAQEAANGESEDGDCHGGRSDDESDDDQASDDDGCDDCVDCDGCDGCEEEDEEHEKDEEARRIGLATTEIEDIIQKLCLMIQKGVLGLDEPIVVDAVSMLRKIERGLGQEAVVWKRELSRSRSMFGISSSNTSDIRPDLLLTQGIDLSFLNFSPDEEAPIAQGLPAGTSNAQTSKHHTAKKVETSPVNAAISNLPTAEQERDQDMCRAIRIRIMFTLGWVHQQKGEYHYGAQAYGVCNDIAKTGKRPLDALQQQALVQKQACKDLEIKAKEQAVLESIRLQERKEAQAKRSETKESISAPSSAKSTRGSYASSFFATSEASFTGNSEISSPSSVSSNESVSSQSRGASSTISSLSAVLNSTLFRSNTQKSTGESQDGSKKSTPKLQRSKSLLLGLKSKPLEIPDSTTEVKDSNQQHHHHHPRAQHRIKHSQQQQQRQQQLRQQSMPTLTIATMAAHQKNAVQCGYCGQTRVLMPLCVCKKVRYCNGECRIADLATHRLTGCHAAKIGMPAIPNPHHPPATPGVAL